MSSSSSSSSTAGFLILFALVVVTIFPVLAPAAIFGCAHFRVHVIDGFSTNDHPLLLHCWSKNDDLGNHTLWTNGDFNFHFGIPLVGQSKFQCDMNWGTKHKHVAVFTEGVEELTCCPSRNCYWRSQDDGIYFSVDGNNYAKKMDWDN